MKYSKETFEDFLSRMHMNKHTLNKDMIILYAEKWHTEQLLAHLNNK